MFGDSGTETAAPGTITSSADCHRCNSSGGSTSAAALHVAQVLLETFELPAASGCILIPVAESLTDVVLVELLARAITLLHPILRLRIPCLRKFDFPQFSSNEPIPRLQAPGTDSQGSGLKIDSQGSGAGNQFPGPGPGNQFRRRFSWESVRGKILGISSKLCPQN
jgi:hypothetical protein